MRNSTKASRDAAREYQFKSLIDSGFIRETYKGLDFFTKTDGKYFTLKVFRGNAAKHEEYINYRSLESRSAVIQNYKSNYERRAAYKAEQKAKGYTSSHAGASAAVKAELQAAFKGIKFSVTSDSYSGGNSVHISWIDGPTTAEVKAISDKYQYGHFNGMEDIYENTNDRDDIPQVKYVSESRKMSEEVEALTPEFTKLFHPDQANDYRNAPDQILYRIFAATSFPATYTNLRIEKTDTSCGRYEEFYKLVFDVEHEYLKQSTQSETVEVAPDSIVIIQYGKGLAVIGNTKPIKDDLKALGGRFNFRLTCGPGWVFQSSKLEELKALLTTKAKKEETTLKDEIKKTVEFFAETDLNIYGEVQESTVNIAEVQKVTLSNKFEEVQTYNNLEDINEAAKSGKVISLSNLFDLVTR